MTTTPTPEAVEAVARAIHAAEFSSSYDEDIDEYERELDQRIAEAAITAFLAHQQQHAPDTLAADLAAILEHPLRYTVTIDPRTYDFYEVSGVSASDYHHDHLGTGPTIPEAVAALRAQIEQGAE